MLLVGSKALEVFCMLQEGKTPNDLDTICTFAEFQKWSRDHKDMIAHCVPLSGDKFHVRDKTGFNYEFEIAWPGSTGEALLQRYEHPDRVRNIAPPEVCLALKLSHKYLKDSPHFLKTMRDIQWLQGQGVELDAWLKDWLPIREAETYVYNHPKLDVSKDDFFKGDGVQYVYDHDTIHLTVALIERTFTERCGGPSVPGKMVSYGREVTRTYPAYTFYMKDGSEVMTSKDKFMSVPEQIRLYGVYEESCVLALERSQIPYVFMGGTQGRRPPTARQSFEMALMKVCTSITSGWFREYAWDNYDKVMALYEELGENDYVERFQRNAHMLKPHTVGMM